MTFFSRVFGQLLSLQNQKAITKNQMYNYPTTIFVIQLTGALAKSGHQFDGLFLYSRH